MCKYCKRLKELKELDKKEYRRILSLWRRYSVKSNDLLSEALDILDLIRKYPDEKIPCLLISDLCFRIKYYFDIDYIGK